MFKNIWNWFKYRTIKRNHVLKLDIKPGEYEKHELLMCSCFQLLVDHIEEDLALYYDFGHKNPKRSTGRKFLELQVKKLNSHRVSSQEGETTLSLEQQAEIKHLLNCEKLLGLYDWWKDTRSQRGDIFTHSGFREYYDELIKKYGEKKLHEMIEKGTAPELERLEKLSNSALYIKDQWEKEDRERLHELILLKDYLREPK